MVGKKAREGENQTEPMNGMSGKKIDRLKMGKKQVQNSQSDRIALT